MPTLKISFVKKKGKSRMRNGHSSKKAAPKKIDRSAMHAIILQQEKERKQDVCALFYAHISGEKKSQRSEGKMDDKWTCANHANAVVRIRIF